MIKDTTLTTRVKVCPSVLSISSITPYDLPDSDLSWVVVVVNVNEADNQQRQVDSSKTEPTLHWRGAGDHPGRL